MLILIDFIGKGYDFTFVSLAYCNKTANICSDDNYFTSGICLVFALVNFLQNLSTISNIRYADKLNASIFSGKKYLGSSYLYWRILKSSFYILIMKIITIVKIAPLLRYVPQ